jgi:hypothetical protein
MIAGVVEVAEVGVIAAEEVEDVRTIRVTVRRQGIVRIAGLPAEIVRSG